MPIVTGAPEKENFDEVEEGTLRDAGSEDDRATDPDVGVTEEGGNKD